jgi:hypothetical protein
VIHLFCGFDKREAVGWHVFVHSVLARASAPVATHRLDNCGLPQGSNAFTLSRFLVPWLMCYQGHAIFADAADMLMLDDIAELDAQLDPSKAVQLVRHDYLTRNPVKYLGTSMQCPNRDYKRKNWASLMLMNCAHDAWRACTPASLASMPMIDALQLCHVADDDIGTLPDRWNRLVDEGQAVEGASLLHWTAGIPGFPHYRNAPGAELWFAERDQMLETA